MKEIILTQGKVALVDDEDYERVNQYKWHYIKGYGYRTIWRKEGSYKVSMQSLIFTDKPGFIIDHRDNCGLNNQKYNLRYATKQQNQMNSKGLYEYKGIFWEENRKKWRAKIGFNKKSIFLGRFNTDIEAAKAYDEAAIKYFGEFAKLNFPI